MAEGTSKSTKVTPKKKTTRKPSQKKKQTTSTKKSTSRKNTSRKSTTTVKRKNTTKTKKRTTSKSSSTRKRKTNEKTVVIPKEFTPKIIQTQEEILSEIIENIYVPEDEPKNVERQEIPQVIFDEIVEPYEEPEEEVVETTPPEEKEPIVIEQADPSYSPRHGEAPNDVSSKNKDGFWLLEGIFVIVMIFTIFFIFYMLSLRENQEKDYNILVHDYSLLEKEKNDITTEIDNLNKEIDDYKNIDQTIELTKKKYFEGIKQLEDDILAGKSDKKIAYLTFDDGPYYNTYKIFDILDQYGVKATFFTTNTNGEYCFDNKSANCWIRYSEYLDRGHTIANHTYTHAIWRGLYSSPDAFMNAVIDQENLVKEKTGGYVTNIVRFPGGSVTAGSLKDPIIEKLRERGYGWADWNAEDGDGRDLSSSEEAFSIFTRMIDEKLEVVLLHDYNAYTTAILPQMIEYLQSNGYELYPLFYESHMVNK